MNAIRPSFLPSFLPQFGSQKEVGEQEQEELHHTGAGAVLVNSLDVLTCLNNFVQNCWSQA
jgi:hypothetical protein